MAHTERELEMEGRTLHTQELLTEAKRMVDLARTHAMELRGQNVELKTVTELDQLKEMVAKEHARVEAKPPKPVTLSKEQEKLMTRAFQWRAVLVRRADRAYIDERMQRLRYHRMFELHHLPERLYEELSLLLAQARQDARRLAPTGVDEAFLNQGEDLLYELQGLPVPDRTGGNDAQNRGRPAYGKPPPEPARLPPVSDTAHALNVLKGRLYMAMRDMSYGGQVAFCLPTKDPTKAESIRRAFALRVKPSEDEEEFFTLGRSKGEAPGSSTSLPTAAAAPVEPAPAPKPSPPSAITPPQQQTSKPGGPNPPPPADPFKKPPPKAVGLVRPSPTHGNK